MKHSSRTEISHQKPFLRAHIFFIRRCHEQELIAHLKRSRGIKFLIVLGSRHSRKHVIVLIGNRLPEWLASFIIIIFFLLLIHLLPILASAGNKKGTKNTQVLMNSKFYLLILLYVTTCKSRSLLCLCRNVCNKSSHKSGALKMILCSDKQKCALIKLQNLLN